VNNHFLAGNSAFLVNSASQGIATTESGVSDCTIFSEILIGGVPGSPINFPGVAFRYTGTDDYWVAGIDCNSQKLKLVKIDGGAMTTEDDANITVAYQDLVPIQVHLQGDSISATALGQTVSTSDSFNATATKHGLAHLEQDIGEAVDRWTYFKVCQAGSSVSESESAPSGSESAPSGSESAPSVSESAPSASESVSAPSGSAPSESGQSESAPSQSESIQVSESGGSESESVSGVSAGESISESSGEAECICTCIDDCMSMPNELEITFGTGSGLGDSDCADISGRHTTLIWNGVTSPSQYPSWNGTLTNWYGRTLTIEFYWDVDGDGCCVPADCWTLKLTWSDDCSSGSKEFCTSGTTQCNPFHWDISSNFTSGDCCDGTSFDFDCDVDGSTVGDCCEAGDCGSISSESASATECSCYAADVPGPLYATLSDDTSTCQCIVENDNPITLNWNAGDGQYQGSGAACAGDTLTMYLEHDPDTCLWKVHLDCGGGGLPDGSAEGTTAEESCDPFSLSIDLNVNDIATNTECCTAGGTLNVSITE